jgi:TolB-like protein
MPEQRAASIAVAPLRQAPADADHARLASAFFEDVIAELSSFPQLEVLGARTCLGLTAAELAPAALAKRFGVTHLLDSTLSAREGALEVKASILEAPSGKQIWSTKLSVPMTRAELQPSELAAQVANHLSARINMARLASAKQRPLTSLPAYDLWLRGRDCLRRGTVQADAEARELFERALELDPTYARGYVGLSLSHFNEWSCQLWQAWEESERLAYEYAKRALELDESDPVAHSMVGRILMYRRSFAQGRHHLERALALSPNDADMLAHSSMFMGFLGEVEAAVAMSQKAFRLNPLHDESYFVLAALPYFVARRLDDGLALMERAPPNLIVDQSAFMAACYAHLGDMTRAKQHVAQFLGTFTEKITFGRVPDADEPLAYLLHVNPFAREEDAKYFVEGLKKAGLGGEPRSSGVSFEPLICPGIRASTASSSARASTGRSRTRGAART